MGLTAVGYHSMCCSVAMWTGGTIIDHMEWLRLWKEQVTSVEIRNYKFQLWNFEFFANTNFIVHILVQEADFKITCDTGLRTEAVFHLHWFSVCCGMYVVDSEGRCHAFLTHCLAHFYCKLPLEYFSVCWSLNCK